MRFGTESCHGVSPFITEDEICAEWLEQASGVLYNKRKVFKSHFMQNGERIFEWQRKTKK